MRRKDKRKLKNTILKKNFNILDLYKAYWDCRKGKRSSLSSLEFEYNLETNMMKLYEDLKSGNYKIGESICFVILEPKPREIWAASFRDRIVHHLVYNAIKDRFYAHFIKETFSCIPKRGTLRAAIKVSRFTQSASENFKKKTYYLKADIKNFFVSIDKRILYKLMIERVPEKWLFGLIYQIIFNDPRGQSVIQSPDWKFKLLSPNKSLWHAPVEKGLPIGNLTSQFFSNVYLNKLDQFIKRKLKCKYYCRYVDDFVIFNESPAQLNFYYREIAKFLKDELKLELHKDKRTINLISNGVDFVGYKIKANRMFLRKKTIKKVFRATDKFKKKEYDIKEKTLEKLYCSFNSYLGQLRAVNGFNLRKKLCEKISFPHFCHNPRYEKVKRMYVLQKALIYGVGV